MDPDDFWALAGEYCTDRELEALRLIAKDHTYRTAGDELGISKQAVHRRVRRAIKRIQAKRPPRVSG